MKYECLRLRARRRIGASKLPLASAAQHENFSNFVGKPARRACVEKYAQVDHSVLS